MQIDSAGKPSAEQGPYKNDHGDDNALWYSSETADAR
jgi:hypothetical protein